MSKKFIARYLDHYFPTLEECVQLGWEKDAVRNNPLAMRGCIDEWRLAKKEFDQ